MLKIIDKETGEVIAVIDDENIEILNAKKYKIVRDE